MEELKVLTAAQIVKINEEILGFKADESRQSRVESCLSSYYYYDTLEEQISSIVLLIIKNHVFVDANKRTAFMTFITLVEINDLTAKLKLQSKYAAIFENIAANHYTVDQAAKLLFKQD